MIESNESEFWKGGPDLIGLIVSGPMLVLYAAAAMLFLPDRISGFLWAFTNETVANLFDRFWVDSFVNAVQPWMREIGWFLIAVGGLHLLTRIATRWVLTQDRLGVRSGLIIRGDDEIELYRVVDVRSARGPIQFLVGVGDVAVMSSDASGTVVLRGVRNPDRLRYDVRTLSEECKTKRGFRVLE